VIQKFYLLIANAVQNVIIYYLEILFTDCKCYLKYYLLFRNTIYNLEKLFWNSCCSWYKAWQHLAIFPTMV